MKKLICFFMFFLLLNASVVFAETEEEKYRVNAIHPVQVGSGITTGGVIAYGHYIKPPYQVTMELKDIIVNFDKDMNPIKEKQYFIFINGVQVVPNLSMRELKTGKIIRGMESVNVNKERIKRISSRETDTIQERFYELVKEKGKAAAIEEIKNDLKINKHVKNYNIDDKNDVIKTDFGDGEINFSFDEFARLGLFNKTRKIVSYLENNYGKWEYEYGKSKADEMLYEYLKNNPLIEKYEAFYKSRWIKVKFKDDPTYEEFYLQGYRYILPNPKPDPQKQGELMAEGIKNSLSLGGVEIFRIGGGVSGMRDLEKAVKIMKRQDIDNNTKEEFLIKDIGLDKDTAKEILYNFDPVEYHNFGE